MRSTERWMWAMVVLAAAGGLVGCASNGQVAGGDVAGVADENSAEYLDRMSKQTTVTQNDALSGMLLLLDGKDDAGTFARRIEPLKQRGVLAESWSHDASRALTRGRLAYMVCQACKIKGGIILRLFGPSRRYCLRELQYMEMMGKGTQGGEVSGMELVAVITRADEYIRTGKVPDIAGGIKD